MDTLKEFWKSNKTFFVFFASLLFVLVCTTQIFDVQVTHPYQLASSTLTAQNPSKSLLSPISPTLITVVSMFIYIPTVVRHSLSDFESWMSSYFETITAPLVIFVSGYDVKKIRRLRGDKPLIIHEISSVWELPHASDMELLYNSRQWQIDPEREIHIPELYAIWNSKSALLSQVSLSNPFNSRFFLYADVGAFRNGSVRSPWPDEKRVLKLFSQRPDGMAFGIIQPLTVLQKLATAYKLSLPRYKDAEWRRTTLVQGGWFAGNAQAVQRFSDSFYDVLYSGSDSDAFVGKDQEIMTFLAARDYDDNSQNASFFVGGDQCGTPWFWFTFFFRAQDIAPCSTENWGTEL